MPPTMPPHMGDVCSDYSCTNTNINLNPFYGKNMIVGINECFYIHTIIITTEN